MDERNEDDKEKAESKGGNESDANGGDGNEAAEYAGEDGEEGGGDNGDGGEGNDDVGVKQSKKNTKQDERDSMKAKFDKAVAAFKAGEFPSLTACAVAFGVNRTSLSKFVKSGKAYVGSGKVSSVFSEEEERQIVNHAKARVELGAGLSFKQLCLLIQELLQKLKKVNPGRCVPAAWENFYPEETDVLRFVARNNLSIRRTMALHDKGEIC